MLFLRNFRDLFHVTFIDLLLNTIGIDVTQQAGFGILWFAIGHDGASIIGVDSVRGPCTTGQSGQGN